MSKNSLNLSYHSSLNENMKLAKILKSQLRNLGKDSKIIDLLSLELPMYSSKEESNGIPEPARDLVKEMKNAKGHIFISPEYNYLPAPVLVNTINWISRVSDDFRESFDLKPVQLATHSGSSDVSCLMNSMRIQFTKLGSIVMPREIVTAYDKPLDKEKFLEILKQYIYKKERKL